MSMLSRFRKSGGFYQLLSLLESCDAEKQKQLLHLVASEDPGWAHLVKIKVLTVEKILNWPTNVLQEIAAHVPDSLHLSLLIGFSDYQKQKWISALPTMRGRDLKDRLHLFTANPQEAASAAIKLVQIVRELESEGKIHFKQFDPSLIIEHRLVA